MGNPIPGDARQAVYARDMGTCIRCGCSGSDIHHRMRRREGKHALSNLILLCAPDHREVHANPAWARERGLIVSVHAKSVQDVPVWTFAGPVILHDDGTASPAEREWL